MPESVCPYEVSANWACLDGDFAPTTVLAKDGKHLGKTAFHPMLNSLYCAIFIECTEPSIKLYRRVYADGVIGMFLSNYLVYKYYM